MPICSAPCKFSLIEKKLSCLSDRYNKEAMTVTLKNNCFKVSMMDISF